MKATIADRPKFYRAAPSRGAKPKVDRNGGDRGAGIIRGASMTTVGEALGHRKWLDKEFASSVHEQMAAAGSTGLKMRFTHPGLSSDGLGTFLGRGKNPRLEGGQVFADIHFSKSSRDTPDGDLADYVMTLAEEDPEAFGTSIVFEPDYEAEDKFVEDHSDDKGKFNTPDENNVQGYPHARLARLRAADVVDEPAANPGGLFRANQAIADEADKLCAFAIGLSDQRPVMSHLSVDPDRTAAFVGRFLESHNLELRERNMPADTITKEQLDAAQAAANEKYAALEAKFTELSEKLSPPADDQPTTEEIEKRGALRASQIMAAAAMSGLADHDKLAAEAIDKGFSVETFKASITDRLIAGNGLTKDAGQDDPDPHAKFRAEFRADIETFAKFGITDEDAYVRSRCDEMGLPIPAKKAG